MATGKHTDITAQQASKRSNLYLLLKYTYMSVPMVLMTYVAVIGVPAVTNGIKYVLDLLFGNGVMLFAFVAFVLR